MLSIDGTDGIVFILFVSILYYSLFDGVRKPNACLRYDQTRCQVKDTFSRNIVYYCWEEYYYYYNKLIIQTTQEDETNFPALRCIPWHYKDSPYSQGSVTLSTGVIPRNLTITCTLIVQIFYEMRHVIHLIQLRLAYVSFFYRTGIVIFKNYEKTATFKVTQ